MNIEKKVYIIIPVYNTEAFLEKCLNSVFKQTYKNIFVICVNDGSKDNSLMILEKYKKYSNFMIVNKENGGLSSARNAGLKEIDYTEDSYITFIDSDDWIDENYIEKLVFSLDKEESDICCCSYSIVCDGDSNDMIIKDNLEDKTYSLFESLKLLFSNKLQSHAQTKLYKSELWKDTFFDENVSFMEDQATTYKIFSKCNKISTINYCGYYFFMRKGSLCRSEMKNKKILDAAFAYMQNFEFNYETLTKEEQEEIHTLNLQQFGNVFLMLYPRFNKKKATETELIDWKKVVSFEKEHKAVRKFKPINGKQKLKKICFICLKPFYKFIFRTFMKIS